MASACDTKRKKKGPEESRAVKGNAQMSNLPLDSFEATKVIAKACNWADRRRDVQDAPPADKRLAEGRYKVSRIELAEAVEHYRSAGKKER